MPADLNTTLAQALATIPSVSSKTAVFIRREGARVVVNIGDGSVELPFVGMTLPPPGHPVQLELKGTELTVTGPARPLPSTGEITAVGAPTATVTAWGIDYKIPYRAGYTPTIGDDVEIAWGADGGYIQGAVSLLSTSIPAPAENPPPGAQTYHPAPFTAIDSGSYNGGWWTRDVYASDGNAGAYFYGDKLRDTIPDNAIIRAARIYLNPRQEYGYAPNLRLHTAATRPGGTVTFTGSAIALPTRSGWVDIPLAFIDFLKANAGGIGFDHGGYNIFRGTQADAIAGALDISWEA